MLDIFFVLVYNYSVINEKGKLWEIIGRKTTGPKLEIVWLPGAIDKYNIKKMFNGKTRETVWRKTIGPD